MNPQPVSLADELRKLEQELRKRRPEGSMCWEIADELSALLNQHAVAEPQVYVPMREWLKAKRIELSAEQLWAVESYLVMNVLPIAPAHAVADVTEAMKSCDGTLERLVKHYAELFTTMTPPPIEEAIKVLKGLMYGTYWCGVEFAEQQAAHAAEQPKLTEEQAHAVVIDFWNKREMPQHPISSWESALVQFALLTSPVAPPPRIDHCPTCKSEQKGDTKNLVGHFPCLDLWHTTPHNSTKNPKLPYCKTENCWSWKTTGSEYCGLQQPPVAPGEQPPRNPYENAICNHQDRNNPNHVHTHACPQAQPSPQTPGPSDREEGKK